MIPAFPNSALISTRERFVLKGGRWKKVTLKVRFGLVVHPDYGPILIDTGYGPKVTNALGRSWGLRAYATLFKPLLLPQGSPKAALAKLGFAPQDVTRIVVTHFHADHIASLRQFPNARFVAQKEVFKRIIARGVWHNLHRGIFPELLPDDFSQRLIDVQDLETTDTPLGRGWDLLGDRRMIGINLPGHAEGHFGVYFAENSMLYAVDTQWMTKAICSARLPGFPASRIAEDGRDLEKSTQKVAQFIADGGQVVTCHDPENSDFDLLEGG